MSERPHGVIRYIAEQEQGSTGALPVRVPGDAPTAPRPDTLADQRYAALDDWSQSAATMTMSAVTDHPPAYPARHSAPAEPTPAPSPYAPALGHPPAYPPSGPRLSVSSGAPDLPGSPELPGASVLSAGQGHPGGPERPAARSWRRPGALAAAAAAVLVAGGVAFALIGGSGDDAATVPPAVVAAGLDSAAPTAGDEHPETLVDPAATPTAAASATTSPTAGASPTAATTRIAPAVAGAATHDLTATTTSTPGETSPAGSAELSAFYRGGVADTGYEGTIQVVNSGDATATGWTVTLTVPGGEEVSVTSGPATASQSGTTVTFRSTGTLAAADAITIAFSLDGVPTTLPSGCTINDTPCA
ncbi:cellulose binding domain-containing protein [Actinoplanes sp. NPDC051851]|uniref:cellulose binding domain-containing protein n=1 Tax=Actinoplanes sp. NPDC051851 TaxID=3154753 RepID=UPI0034308BD5